MLKGQDKDFDGYLYRSLQRSLPHGVIKT